MFYDQSRLMCHFLLAEEKKLSDKGSIQKWNIQELPEWIIICASLRHKKSYSLFIIQMNNANTNYWSCCSRHLNVHQLAQKWWLHYALVKDTCMTCCEVNKTTNTRAFLPVWNFLETTYCDMRKFVFCCFQNLSMLVG